MNENGLATGRPVRVAAELDLGEIVRAKFDLDVVGHYARPDVFRLVVDTRAQVAVRSIDGTAASDPEPETATPR